MTAMMRTLRRSLALPSSTRMPLHPGIAVRFRDGAWHVEGVGASSGELWFHDQADAERVALAIARRRGCVACVYDRNNRLVDSYLGG